MNMKRIKRIIQNAMPIGAAAEMLTPQSIPSVPEFQLFNRGTCRGGSKSPTNTSRAAGTHRNKANLKDSFDR